MVAKNTQKIKIPPTFVNGNFGQFEPNDANKTCLKTVIFNYYNQLNNVISNNIKDYLRVELNKFFIFQPVYQYTFLRDTLSLHLCRVLAQQRKGPDL